MEFLQVSLMKKILKPFYILFGFLFLGLGVIGIFLPLLPTTPFILLSLLCFSQGESRFVKVISESKLIGPYIQDWQQNRRIPIKAKLTAFTMIYLSSLKILFFSEVGVVQSFSLFIILIFVVCFLMSRRG
jgi:uncharacterized membrane protein YbaN (DUF454 family)